MTSQLVLAVLRFFIPPLPLSLFPLTMPRLTVPRPSPVHLLECGFFSRLESFLLIFIEAIAVDAMFYTK